MKSLLKACVTRPNHNYHSVQIFLINIFLVLVVFLSSADAQKTISTSHGRNYVEANVGIYTLPDSLLGKDGRRVTDTNSWIAVRRGEILRDFRDLMYGHNPELPVTLRTEVVATRKDAVNGLATRTLITLRFFDDPHAPRINLMLYVPKKTTKPVPVFLGLSFYGNASVEDDPSIPLHQGWMRRHSTSAMVDHRATESLRGISAHRWPLALALKHGYGVATFYYGDVEPDHIEGWRDGIRGYALKRAGRTKPAPNEWGALGAWAWGLSRVLDYLETNPAVDASRVVVFGHSRLGKTALWAGAQDERFALVISNNSGEGGASLARRNFGENIAYSIAHASWRYCDRFRDFIDREKDLPFDQHMLLALIAPRPIYVSSATEDLLADPKGEFLSTVHAEPVYRLFGLPGVNTTQWPGSDRPVGRTIGYHLRTGKHAITAYDWEQFIRFADRHLRGLTHH
ncbi:acetylxylan esterase [Planctomycetota bacterium]